MTGEITGIFPYPADILDMPDFPRNCQDTYLRILRACWRPELTEFDWSDLQTYRELGKDFRLPRKTVYDHISRLKVAGLIEIEPVGFGIFRLRPAANSASLGEFWETLRHLAIDRPTTVKDSESIKEHKDQGQETTGRNLAKLRRLSKVGENPPSAAELADLLAFLGHKGVRQPALAQIGSLDPDYVHAYFDYAELAGESLANIINALKCENPVPEYCSVCGGLNGIHKFVRTADEPYLQCPIGQGFNLSEAEDEFGLIEKITSW
jgi:hypothetical protein